MSYTKQKILFQNRLHNFCLEKIYIKKRELQFLVAPTCRFVCPSIGRSVGCLVTFYFFIFFYVFAVFGLTAPAKML